MQRRKFLKTMTLGGFIFNPLFADEIMNLGENHKILVVYYSRTLNTEILAQYLHKLLKADIFALETLKKYPDDLQEMLTLVIEETNKNIYAELKKIPDLSAYDTIFVGSPIWNSTLSSPVASFLANSDFKGKTLIPFLTHCGYGIGNAAQKIKNLAKNAQVGKILVQENFCERDKKNLREINLGLISKNQQFSIVKQREVKEFLGSLDK